MQHKTVVPSARPTIPPEAITILTWKLFWFAWFWKDMSENNDHPWFLVGRVDQKYETTYN